MNEFYSISQENQKPDDEYQLKNLGKQTIMMIVGRPSRRNYWGETESPQSQKFYRDTNEEDYDRLFANKLLKCRPPYDLEKILDYHLNYYVEIRKGEKLRFLNQIKFVILPIIKEKNNKEIYDELITNWLENNNMTTKKEKAAKVNLKIRDINAPMQIQMNSDNASQSQQISYDKDDILELLNLLKQDIENLNTDSKEDFELEIENAIKQLNKGKKVETRLLTIGSMIKEIGIGIFVNLVSSPLFEIIRPILGI
jgi:hypothetical protein